MLHFKCIAGTSYCDQCANLKNVKSSFCKFAKFTLHNLLWIYSIRVFRHCQMCRIEVELSGEKHVRKLPGSPVTHTIIDWLVTIYPEYDRKSDDTQDSKSRLRFTHSRHIPKKHVVSIRFYYVYGITPLPIFGKWKWKRITRLWHHSYPWLLLEPRIGPLCMVLIVKRFLPTDR